MLALIEIISILPSIHVLFAVKDSSCNKKETISGKKYIVSLCGKS